MRSRLVIALASLLLMWPAAGCGGGWKETVHSQSPAPERKIPPAFTSNTPTFTLDYDFSAPEYRNLGSLDLWVQAGDWTFVRSVNPQAGNVEFTAPADGEFGFRLTQPDARGERVSPRGLQPDFIVVVDTLAPVVVLGKPNGGEAFPAGDMIAIDYTAFDKNLAPLGLSFDWSEDGGKSWQPIANRVENAGTFSWASPRRGIPACLLRVSAVDTAGNKGADISDAPFEIAGAAPDLSLDIAAALTLPAGAADVDYAIRNTGRRDLRLLATVAPAAGGARREILDTDGVPPIRLDLPAGDYTIEWELQDADGKTIHAHTAATRATVAAPAATGLQLTTFTGGEIVPIAAERPIQWTVTGGDFDDYSATIEVRKDGGEWQDVLRNRPLRNQHTWRTPLIAGEYELRVTLTHPAGDAVSAASGSPFFVGAVNPVATVTQAIFNADKEVVLDYRIDGFGSKLATGMKIWLWKESTRSWDVLRTYGSLPDVIRFPLEPGDYGFAATVETSANIHEQRPMTARDVEAALTISADLPDYSIAPIRDWYRWEDTLEIAVVSGDSGAAISKVELSHGDNVLRTVTADAGTRTRLPIAVQGLEDGLLTVTAYLTNAQGKVFPCIRQTRIDHQGPRLSSPSGFIVTGNARNMLQYEISDEGSGVASARLLLFDQDRKPLQTLTLDPAAKGMQIDLPEGAYYFRLAAEDTLGNASETDPARPYYLAVDRTPPTLQLLSQASDQRIPPATPVNIQWKAADVNFGAMPISLYYSTTGGQDWQPIELRVPNTGVYEWLPPAGAAPVLIRITAVDLADLKSEATGFGAIRIEGAGAMAAATGPRFSMTRDVQLTYRAAAETPRLKTVELWYRPTQQIAWVRYNNEDPLPGSPFPWTAPADGEFAIYLRGIAENGVAAPAPEAHTPAQLLITIDSRPQSVTLENFNAEAVYRGGATQRIEWTIDPATIRENSVTVDFRPFAAAQWVPLASRLPATGGHDWDVPQIDTNEAALRISAEQADGNRTVLVSRNIWIDSIPPAFSGSAETLPDGTIRVRYRATDGMSPEIRDVALWLTDDGGRTWNPGAENITAPYVFRLPHDGEFGFLLCGADLAGNRNPAPNPGTAPAFVVTVDSAAPLVRLKNFQGGPDAWFAAGSTQYVFWQATDANLPQDCIQLLFSRDDGRTWQPIEAAPVANSGSYAWTLPNAGDVAATDACRVKIVATDATGNAAESASPAAFRIDGTPPAFTVDGVSNPVAQKEVRIRLTIADAESGPAATRLYYRPADVQGWRDYTRGADPVAPDTLVFTELDGEYELFVVVADRAGNQSPPPLAASAPLLNVSVDSTGPVFELSGLAANDIVRKGDSREIRWVSRDPHLAANAVTLKLMDDAGATVLASGLPAEGAYTLVMKDGIDGQQYRLLLESLDQAGNAGNATVPFYVDAGAPMMGMELAEGPVNGAVTLKVDGSDEFSGIQSIHLYVRRNRGLWEKFTTTDRVGLIPYTLPGDGIYDFFAVGQDLVGNLSPAPSDATEPLLNVVYDTAHPRVEFAEYAAGPLQGGAELRVKLTVQDASYLHPDTLTFACSTDDRTTWRPVKCKTAEWNKGATPETWEATAIVELPLASHPAFLLKAEVEDGGHNIGSGVAPAVAIDAEPPQATIRQVRDAGNGDVFIDCQIRDNGPAGVARIELWTLAEGGQWTKFDAGFPATGDPLRATLPHAAMSLSAVAIDMAGNREEAPAGSGERFVEFTFTALPALPTLTIVPAGWEKPLRGGSDVEIRWEAAGPHLKAMSLQIEFSTDDGAAWTLVQKDLETSGAATWIVPRENSTQCKLRFTVADTFEQQAVLETKAFAIDSRGNTGQLIFEDTPPAEPVPAEGANPDQPIPNPHETGTPAEHVNEFPDPAEHDKPDTTDPKLMTLPELLYMGRTKFAEARFEEAVNFFEEVLVRDPRNAESHGALGRIHARQKDRARAAEYLDKAVQYKSVDPAVYMDYGVLRYSNNEFVEARTLFSTAAALYKGDDANEQARIHFNLGACEFVLRNYRNAVSAFQTAYAKDGRNKRCALYLAKCYTELAKAEPQSAADKDNALHYWTQVLNLYTLSTDEGRDAQRMIDELKKAE